MFLSTRYSSSEESFKRWYRQASSHADIMWKSIESSDSWGNSTQELCLLRRIPIISTGEFAVLIIKVSNNYLKNRILNNSQFYIISFNQDPVFYSTRRNQSGKKVSFPINYNEQLYHYSGSLVYEDKKSIANITT